MKMTHTPFPRRTLLTLASAGLGVAALAGFSACASDSPGQVSPASADGQSPVAGGESAPGLSEGSAPLPAERRRGSPAQPPVLTTDSLLGKRLRVIRPNQPVTMDYSEDRVNIEVDDRGVIQRISLG